MWYLGASPDERRLYFSRMDTESVTSMASWWSLLAVCNGLQTFAVYERWHLVVFEWERKHLYDVLRVFDA